MRRLVYTLWAIFLLMIAGFLAYVLTPTKLPDRSMVVSSATPVTEQVVATATTLTPIVTSTTTTLPIEIGTALTITASTPADDAIGRQPWTLPPTTTSIVVSTTTSTTMDSVVVTLPEDWQLTSPCHGLYPGACLVTERDGRPIVYNPLPYPGWPAPPQ